MRISDWSSDVCPSDLNMETIMDEFETTESDGFVLLPAANGGGALVRRSQIAGARANGRDGAIVYAKCGPSIYTTATRSEEHRVGKECVRPCRSRGSQYNDKKKTKSQQ